MRTRARATPEAAEIPPFPSGVNTERRLPALPAASRRSALFAAGLGAAIVIAIAVPLAAVLNIWIDEAFTLHSTGAGAAYAWREAIEFEAQPPLYFVIEAAWRTFDEGSIVFARFPSAVFVAAGVAVIVGAARQFAPNIPPLTVALVTAFNPIAIWAATEMRVYPLVFLAGSVLTWTFFSGYLRTDRSRRAQMIYIGAAIVALYTQYYTGFFLLAHAVTLIIMRRRAIPAFGGSMAIVALAFAPFAGVALRHVSSSGGFVRHASLAQVVHEIGVNVFDYVLPHDLSWSGSVKILGIAAATALLAIVAFGRPALRDQATRALVFHWVVCVALFVGVFLIAGLPFALRRHLIVMAPATMLLALVLVASLTRHAVLIRLVVLTTFVAGTLATLGTQYRSPLARTGDWQRVAALLASDPAAPIAVFPAEFALALRAYSSLAIVPIPVPMPFDYTYVQETALRDESQVASVLDPLDAHADRLWLVTADVCDIETSRVFNYHCRYLSDYLQRRYRVLKTVLFNGSSATLYARISGPGSSDANGRVRMGLPHAHDPAHLRGSQMPAYHS